jgi:hypothetical protein
MKKIILILVLLFFVQYSHAQDTCATALPITAGSYVITAINGTEVPTPLCDTQYGVVPATRPPGGEWYVYTPTENHSVTVTTDLVANAPLVDTRFHVYRGTCAALTCWEGDDDSGTGNSSAATFDVIAGTTYYIAFDNRWTSAGFTFALIENVFVPTPCSSATTATEGITTVTAIDEENIVSPCSTATLAKWYSYSPTIDGTVTISSDLPQNICKDTNFSVYAGTCSGASVLNCLVSDDNSGEISCDSGNTESLLSKKSFSVSAGLIYYIVWDNKGSAEGFDFSITLAPIVTPINYTSQVISTINSTYNICVVDMNGDGIDDIVGVSSQNLKIHYQQPGGTFSISSFSVSGTGTTLPSWSIAAGDYNRDGYNDLLFGAGGGPSFWESNSTGTAYISKTTGTSYLCQRTNFIDVNNDGNLDAFVCDDNNPNRYYLNDGIGNWTHYQSGTTPGAYNLGLTSTGGNYASIWTDIDNDGDRDMFISKCSGPPCELHRNDGDHYTDISAIAGINIQPVQSWSSSVADFDNDGDMDIMIGANGGTNKFFRNNLDTTNETEEPFTNITAGSGLDGNLGNNRDYIAYDFDNDGLVDIFGPSGKILFNKGNNVFVPSLYPGFGVGAVGDLNEDGFLDILNNNTVRYAIPNGNNWFTVRLQGTQSNSNGIGARIEIYGAFGKQIRDIRSGEGFEFMSSLNAHFGLGQATAIETLVVRWPSGIVDTIQNPTINEAFRVTEGSTLSVNSSSYSEFSIYPNPTKGLLNINMKSNSSETFKSAEIFDLTGRSVLNTSLTSMKLNIESLQSGTYLLVLRNKDGKGFTQKFIKE